LRVFCGIDWAEDHHDVALVDVDGKLIAKRRISDDAAGFTLLLELFAEAGDSVEEPMPVAIETGRGLLVACLRATGRQVFAINPMAVSRYRDRHSVARKKSDAGDALMLAHILRTDMAAHRSLPADSELAQAIAVLARAQQDAVWDRTCAHNKLRSLLREYYPAILAAFADKRDGLLRPEARALLAAAPTPAAGAALTRPQLRAALKRAGRQRGIDAEAARIQTALRAPQLRQLPMVENAFGRQALALLRMLDAACLNAEDLAAEASKHLTSTRTPGSSPACPGSALSPAPGCSPRSATTGPASPTLEHSRPTPAQHPSLARAARARPSCTAASRTNAWRASATSGPSPH